ncbi:uncharacterized protein LOC133791794 [Humulus lupulus]|uniref:uncharacterized protein LOC133791794 n=1 Tax=Humulus lupulus TaxID=3486 RepID=UPI002B4015C4|nr:uncharacterized protein LOC133791794 [Humulus lupulus]
MQAPHITQPPSTKPYIEDLINEIATIMLQFQQTTQASIKSLENQVGQLATSYNRLEAQFSNKFPSHPEKNPKENVSAITLQSGIQYEPPTQPSLSATVQNQVVDNFIHDEPSMQKKSHKPTMPTYVPRPPFPRRSKKFKKEEVDKEILETFCKVEKLCTNKKKLKGDEKISVGENVLSVLQKKLPPKCKDLGTFTIPCMIGNKGLSDETKFIVQLVDHTNVYPLGVVEDVLVKVDGLVFPADCYILEMGDASIPNLALVLFRGPFFMTTNTKLDVRAGTLTMEFDGEFIKFNVFDSPGKIRGNETSLKYPT